MCDERITLPKQYLSHIVQLQEDLDKMDNLLEVKVYYRCNTTVYWTQQILDPQLRKALDAHLQRTNPTAALGAVQEESVDKDVHMSAVGIDVFDDNGQPTATDGKAAVAAGALPEPSIHSVTCAVSPNYKKRTLQVPKDSPGWYWFKACCGLVMSAVSSWEIITKEKGVNASGGYLCRHCKGRWSGSKAGSRMLDFFDGTHRLQVILDEPDVHLFNRWAKDRFELYKRLEPNAAPRDEAPPTNVPAKHRIQVGPLLSSTIWSIVLGNHEAPGFRHVAKLAQQGV